MDYETRATMITTHAWEAWTNNGFNLDEDMMVQTMKTVQDAVNNAYFDDLSDEDWLATTLRALNGEA